MDMHKGELFGKQIWLHLGVILLFIQNLIICVLLLSSLWRHNMRMQSNDTGFSDPSTEAHIKAMKVLVYFIILFILNFVGTAIQISSVTVPENKLLFIFGMTTTVLYLWGHSLILILGNRKLKKRERGRRLAGWWSSQNTHNIYRLSLPSYTSAACGTPKQ